MHFTRVRYGDAIRFTLLLLFGLGASGCGEKLQRGTVALPCDDKTVDVDPNYGVNQTQTAVWVCDDNAVTWNASGHDFKVEFKNKSPFADDNKVFDNKHPKSAGTKHLKQLEVFEYRITVDGKPFDPQVIGGGGHLQ